MGGRVFIYLSLLVGGLMFALPGEALTMKECSVNYKAAQDAGTLGGAKWEDFRQANCGDATAPTPAVPVANTVALMSAPTVVPVAAVTTLPAAKPAPAKAVAPSGVSFPSAIDPKYGKERVSLARMHTCRDGYRAAKASNSLGGLRWIQQGGGYYSLCNAKLKSS